MISKRGSTRYQVARRRECSLCIITFKNLDWKECVATLIDISREGVGVESNSRLEPGFVWFRDRLGGFRGGVVMWTRQEERKHRAGIRFVPLSHTEEQFIHEQVALMRSRDHMSEPQAVMATIMESFTRTCAHHTEPEALQGSIDPHAVSTEDDIVGQLRSMIAEL